jgi:hypothetical protein
MSGCTTNGASRKEVRNVERVGAFEPADMRLASKVLLGMEWFVIAQQTGSSRFVMTAC